MPRIKIFKNLVFKEKYKSYHEFHNENRETIYKSIVGLFSEFQKIKNKNLSITIDAKIENIDWTTEIIFNRNEVGVLKKDLIGYFEEIEDYEMCSKIKYLYKTLI